LLLHTVRNIRSATAETIEPQKTSSLDPLPPRPCIPWTQTFPCHIRIPDFYECAATGLHYHCSLLAVSKIVEGE